MRSRLVCDQRALKKIAFHPQKSHGELRGRVHERRELQVHIRWDYMCIMQITIAEGIVQRFGFGVGEGMVIITVINTHSRLHAARLGVEG